MKWLLAALVVLWLACGGPPPLGADDGGADAGPGADAGADGGLNDGGFDGGHPDAGLPDAGPIDAGRPDAGLGDAGQGADGGSGFDAGPSCTALGLPGSCVAAGDCVGARTGTAGLCAGSPAVVCCTPRTAVACDWNARPHPNAGLSEEAGQGGCPSGMRRVDTFCVDVFEASLVEVLDGGVEGSWSPFFNPGSRRVKAKSLRGAVPQGYVSGAEAAGACAEAGKRLCTDAEWQRACRGPDSFVYPYGSVRQPGVCNDARAVHPAIELYGTSASWVFSHLDSPCLNQLPAGLALTGSHPGCVSAEGLYDLMGNLHEWTAAAAGTFRGGYYVDTVLNGNGCLYVTTAHAFSYWDYSTGFRCCAD